MTLKRPKDKGTKAETAAKVLLAKLGIIVKRTPAGTKWDLEKVGMAGPPPLEVLMTRPNYGRWLISMPVEDFAKLYQGGYYDTLRIEVKHWSRFAHHTIYEEKFGR